MGTRYLIALALSVTITAAYPQASVRVNNSTGAVTEPSNFWPGNQSAIASLLTGTYQPIDATLTAIAGLSTSADKGFYFTGTDTVATYTLTSFARSLLDDADASTMRSTLGLVIGTDVLAPSGSGSTLTGVVKAVSAPSSKTDFSTLPGGVAPASGLYQAVDDNWIWSISGGDTVWRQTIRSEP